MSVLRRLVQGDYVLVYSRLLLVGLLEKLERPRIKAKCGLTDEDIADLMASLALHGELVIPNVRVTVCRDPEDNMVLEAALAGSAALVVSGDEDLLILDAYEMVQFVTPREFLTRLDEAVGPSSSDDELPLSFRTSETTGARERGVHGGLPRWQRSPFVRQKIWSILSTTAPTRARLVQSGQPHNAMV